MPAFDLYLRLLQKCQGRVVRSDLGWAADSKTPPTRPTESNFDTLTPVDWPTWKQNQQKAPVNVQRLYVDYTLP